MAEQQIAVLIDYENVGLGSIRWLFDQVSDIGRIVVRRAYGDWSTDTTKRDRGQVQELGIEPIILFHAGASGKNASDLRLAIDAVDLLHGSSFVDTFVIVSGDIDFIPLVTRLRSAGKTVIVAGRKAAVSATLVASCDKFFDLDLAARPNRRKIELSEAPAIFKQSQGARNEAAPQELPDDSLLIRAMRAAMDEQGKVSGSKLLQTMQRIDPGFNYREEGYSTFFKYLQAFSEVKVTRPRGRGDVAVELAEAS